MFVVTNRSHVLQEAYYHNIVTTLQQAKKRAKSKL